MRLMVTGGAGYIGSHFIKAALEGGHNISMIDDLSTGNASAVEVLERIAEERARSGSPSSGDGSLNDDRPRNDDGSPALDGDAKRAFSFYKGSYGDEDLLEQVFQKTRPDAVVHFAAASIVSESMKDPEKYYRDIRLTRTLLDMMERHRVKRLVFSSSAAVYGIPQEIPLKESSPLRPVNPYGEVKAFIERSLYQRAGIIDTPAFADPYGIFHLSKVLGNGKLQFVALRYFNACGAAADGSLGEYHDPETHLIPRLLKESSWELYGTHHPTPDGTCIRDYIHVEDIGRAHLMALDHLTAQPMNRPFGISINLGIGKAFSVREVMESVRLITGHTATVKELPSRQGDPPILIADCHLAEKILGWEPHYTDIDTMIETAKVGLGL